jgi:D-glycero-alpha-D-manno-heptose-7-phosphate kinase
VVTLVGLLKEFKGLPLTEYEIAHLAYVIERERLAIKGGMQDQYAATFGGFNFIEFYKDRVIVNPLRISQDTVNELEHNLLLCYTGKSRVSDRIIEDQIGRYQNQNEEAITGLRQQKELAIEMKDALLERRLDDFGAFMEAAWHYKKKMSSRITTPAIDELHDEALRHGAIGGKITGAGGGGYMLFYCEYEKKLRVAEALRKMGATPTEFGFDIHGLQTWRVNERSRRGDMGAALTGLWDRRSHAARLHI